MPTQDGFAGEVDRGYVCSLRPGWKVRETRHFTVRRSERKVSIPEIRQTLASCDCSYPCKEKDKIRIIKDFRKDHAIHIVALEWPAAKELWLMTVMVLPTKEKMPDES